MYFTYVVRPGDAPEGRGPQFQPFWDGLMSYNLRGGFALQLLGYCLILVSSLLGGNIFCIFGVLNGKAEDLTKVPIVLTFMGTFCWTIGSVWVQNFRSIADDDASIKQSRGFRAGTKGLHQASLLDIVSWSMTTILLFSFMQYFEDAWAAKQVGSGSTAIYAFIARSLHSLALIIYGSSVFLLENFHTEGTAEFWGWALALLYKVAGVAELLALITNPPFATFCNVVFTIVLGFTVFSSLLWAVSFESLIGRTDVKLTQSAMRNEFYKSRNAMAYYGPPTCTEMAIQQEQ